MLKTLLARLHRDEKGAAIVEYAVALLVVAAIGVTTFSYMGAKVKSNATAACQVLYNNAGTSC